MTGDGAPKLRAADVADGMPVKLDGEVWRVWSKRGPKSGTCWLVREVTVTERDEWGVPTARRKTVTREARYAELGRVMNVRNA